MTRREAKKAKAKYQPNQDKKPKSELSPESFYKEHPSWRIRSMEFVGPFGWHIVMGDKLDQIRKRLVSFETMSWDRIIGPENHFIRRNDLSEEARKRLEDLKQEDVDEVFSLRITGKERIFGILENGILRILWWDPEHQVCKSNLKHT